MAVTRAVANLENDLGTRLLQRTTRSVSLTSAGRDFHAKVTGSLAELGAAVRDASNRDREPSGILRVGSSADLPASWLMPTLLRFSDKYPGVTLEVQQSSDLTCLTSLPLDVLLGFAAQGKDLRLAGFRGSRAGSAACGLFATPSYLASSATLLEPSDLRHHARVSPPWLDAPFPGYRIVCGDFVLAHQMTLLGRSLGLLPQRLAEHDVEAERMVPVLGDRFNVWIDLWIASADGPHCSRAATAFCEFAKHDLKTCGVVTQWA
jgi:DNA-binding transcriptional LysR family regulator